MKPDTASRPGMEKGYIKLWRKFRDNPLWREKRKFSRVEAFLDMLLSANGMTKTVMFDGRPLLIKRGQLLTSERKLKDRWGWSKTKTRLFLFYCQNSDRSIKVNSDHKKTIITIINYGVYNPLTKPEKTTETDERKTTERPLKDHRLALTNKDKTKNNLSPEIFSLVDLLIEKMKQNDPKAKIPKTQKQREKWANDFRLLVEKDKRPIEEIKRVLEWCQADSFWRTNILSTRSFRNQYPKLRLRMMEEQSRQGHHESFTDEEYEAYIKQQKEALKK
jgi:hypothetical protein